MEQCGITDTFQMYVEAHWETVFRTKSPAAVSAGESKLVDDLLAAGHEEITILLVA